MRDLHLIDWIAVVAGLFLATLFRRRLAGGARRFYQRTRRRVCSAIDWAMGPPKRIAGEPSLPFYLMVKMPEADYLGIVTFRPYTYGRRRGRKRVEVRAHIVMEPGEAIPLPPSPTGERDAGDAVYSLLVPHANSIEDAGEQLARYATAIRLRRAGWRWTPDDAEKKSRHD
jgi:hypothetical protein